MDAGSLVACLFLVNLVLSPVAELGEILDQTQTAIAGWRKVLDVLDIPIDVVEPDPGVVLDEGPIAVRVERLEFEYREGGRVLKAIDVTLPAGIDVAVVGETGSGKTTFAKLLCRLADPTGGRVVLNDVDLRDIAPDSRHAAVRMVPQDGSCSTRPSVTTCAWVATAPPTPRSTTPSPASASTGGSPGCRTGLDTETGERGENLSVGERQTRRAGPRAVGQSRTVDPRRGDERRRPRDRTGALDGAGQTRGRAPRR